ncbi:MAG: AEC family transporter [Alphaproteobacteria bacterium]|nr:AEC family transporter [Alphaproteobacteria bacterium]
MQAALLPLAPIVGLIVLGWMLRNKGGFGDSLWEGADKLVYWVLFPSLLISRIAAIDVDGGTAGPMMLAMGIAVALGAILVLAGGRMVAVAGDRQGSVLQGAIRINVYVAFALADGLYGKEGIALASVGIAAVIPFVNVVSIIVIPRLTGKQGGNWTAVGKSLATNPILVAIALGALLNLAGGVPPVIGPMLDILGRGALALGLLSVGAAFRLGALVRPAMGTWAACLVKLGIVPLATFGLAVWFGVSGPALAVAVLYNACPTSVSSYIMARGLGAHTGLMAEIITIQTILSFLTLAGWLIVMTG